MTNAPRTSVEPPHADVDYLGDYLDGLLSADARDVLDEHLALCAACRARLGALRLLVERAAHAPVGIDPADDLWPGIHAAIESRRTLALPVGSGPRSAESSRRWRVVTLVFAASAAIAATSALVTLRVVRSTPPAAADPASARGSP
jgi:anti-sigma factor RsiW